MKIFYLLRCSAIRFFIVSALAFNCLPAFAGPIQPGVSLLTDSQFQACLDEAILANGWVATEEITSLSCSNRNIEFLGGIHIFTNLVELNLAGNLIFSAWPLNQLPQLSALNLSDNLLIDVYPLQMLNQLTQLNLGGNSQLPALDVQNIIQNNPGLTHIGVANIAMGDLNWLPPMGFQGEYNLVELDISYTGHFPGLYSIEQYPNLRVLKAAGNRLEVASPLEQLPQLEILDLSNNQLFDVYPLYNLHKLTQLNLSGNSQLPALNVQTIIQNNPDLTHIGVANIAMNDLNWLPPMGYQGEYNLVELDISNTGTFVDLYPLTQYPNLRVLKTAGNQLQTAFPLDQLAQLEILDLSDNQLVDVYPLQMMYNLAQLNLSGNSQLPALDVQTIIQNNPGLTHIGVANIAMNDLNWLPPMDPQGGYNLIELDISHIGIGSSIPYSDLSSVVQYQNLRVLKAAGNQLRLAYPLYQLAQLEILDLSDNQLFDVYPLQNLHKLTQLNLSGNSQLPALDVHAIIQNNPGLTHIGVANIAMNDLNWLPPMDPQGGYNLVELDISHIGIGSSIAYSDLSSVVQYPNLRVLKAAGNQLQTAYLLDQLAQLEILDLSDNQLVDAYPLQIMYNLAQLNLSGNSQLPALDVQTIIQNNPGLTHIGVANIAMNDLNWLPPMDTQGGYNLIELDISHIGIGSSIAYSDLSSVVQYPNLRVLKAAGNQLQTAYPLDQLAQLEILDLSDNQLVDVYPLQMLYNLAQLNLSGNSQLSALDVQTIIQNNPGLTHIGVANIAMNDLNWLPPLNGLPTMGPQGGYNLVELDISNTGTFFDLYPLMQYTNLRTLKAAGNHLQSANPVYQLAQLEILDLSDNQLFDVYPLRNLRKLKQLNLSGNSQLSALDVQTIIQNNPGLTHIGVANIAMNDLNWLPPIGYQGEYNLVELDISNTGTFFDLYPLMQYTNLRVLKAAGNQLQDIYSIGQLQQLEVVDLSNNDLQFVSPLGSFMSLISLDLRGNNNIQCDELEALEAQLQAGVLLRPQSCIYLAPPEIAILSPIGAGPYFQTDSINFVANAYDVEDGNLEALVQWSSNIDSVLGTGASLGASISAGEHIITATVVDSHGNTTSASINLSVQPNTAPQLNIQSIQDGAIFNDGEVVLLTADANDMEEGNISANIQWTSSLSGLLGTGSPVQASLSVGSHVITASITDTAGVTVTQSVTLHINALPVLTLLSPQDGVVFNAGDVVALAGTANDVEDGNIGTTIQWTSSLSGFLGTGIDVQTPLSVGSHVISASITDTAGVTVTQSVTIHINALPTLTLQSPLNGALYMLHETVELRGTANDLEDGDISETIQWSSDIDGVLGTGAVLIKTLSLGVHTVTASITDTNGSTRLLTAQLVIDQIDLGLTVSGKGRKKTATLSWSGSRTLVDIYKYGVVVGAAANAGTAKYRFRNQALFKVCETGTNYCSVEILAQQVR